jgi:hypothetical protein
MRTQIEKLAEDLSAIESYNEELEQEEKSAPIRKYCGLGEYDDEYKASIITCMSDDIDNVNETITSFKDVLEATELMTKEEFEVIDKVLVAFMARLENLK